MQVLTITQPKVHCTWFYLVLALASLLAEAKRRIPRCFISAPDVANALVLVEAKWIPVWMDTMTRSKCWWGSWTNQGMLANVLTKQLFRSWPWPSFNAIAKRPYSHAQRRSLMCWHNKCTVVQSAKGDSDQWASSLRLTVTQPKCWWRPTLALLVIVNGT